MEPQPPAAGAWALSRWTTRAVLPPLQLSLPSGSWSPYWLPLLPDRTLGLGWSAPSPSLGSILSQSLQLRHPAPKSNPGASNCGPRSWGPCPPHFLDRMNSRRPASPPGPETQARPSGQKLDWTYLEGGGGNWRGWEAGFLCLPSSSGLPGSPEV